MARTQVAKAQAQIGKGMVQALTRNRERQSVALTLHHSLETPRFKERLVQIQNALSAMGMSLVVAPITDDSAALAQSEAHNERLQAEKRALQAQVEALQKTIEEHMGTETKWMTLPDAAKEHGVSYPTMWRAHKDGRLVTKIIGGVKNDVIMCDPMTYRRKTRGTRAS